MGRFATLTPRQDDLIRQLVAFSRKAGTECLICVGTLSQNELLPAARSDERLELPAGTLPFDALAAAGFLLVESRQHSDHITMLQLAFDYADYPAKGLARWRRDAAWKLSHDDSLPYQIFWHAVTFGLGVASALLLQHLGG